MRKLVILLPMLVLFCHCQSGESDKTPTSNLAKISTAYGEMYFSLYDETPEHKATFVNLVNKRYYDQFSINRVIKGFVIQGGCPDSVKYFKNSPYLLEPEFRDDIRHKFGALGMGRDDNPDRHSNGCQFYVVTSKNGLPRLDGEYVIFGEIVAGIETLKTIESLKTDHTDTPLEAVTFGISMVNLTSLEVSQLPL